MSGFSTLSARSRITAKLRRALSRHGLQATVLVMVAISFASLGPRGGAGDPGSADKAAHVVAYAIAVLPVALADSRRLVWVTIVLALWGGAIELIQPHFGRSANFFDVLANGVGIAVGAAIGRVGNAVLRHI